MMLFRYPTNVEFGIHMIGSTLFPFYARKQAKVSECKVESKYNLPQEVWQQFCEEFVINTDKSSEPIIPVKIDYTQENYFKSTLSMPQYDRPIKKKYIAVLPVFAEFYHSGGYRATCALRGRDWQRIKLFANQLNYKVVILGLEPDMGIHDRVGKKQDYIGNELMYADYIVSKSKDQYPLGCIEKQLPYVAHASLTIASGGSCVIPLIFGLKSILLDNGFAVKYKTIDGNMLDHYSNICKSVVKQHCQIKSIPFRPNITNRLSREEADREYNASCEFILDSMKTML